MPSKYLEFVEDQHGLHQIGGAMPAELVIPENDFISNFQYIGFLYRKVEAFAWLPFDFNLICPVYLNIDQVYSSANAPRLISPKDTTFLTYCI